MDKYKVTIDQEDIAGITVEMDDPTYEGSEMADGDPEGVYHISADSPEKAVETARWLDSIGNPAYCEGV